jgi:oligoendopeptidase F
LRDYLYKNSESKEEKLFILNQAIEGIRATLFRQTMFAEFELRVNELAEQKKPITPKVLNEMYHSLNEFYFGKDITIDKGKSFSNFLKEIDIEWARIPHFYYNFYVYQYATGIIIS